MLFNRGGALDKGEKRKGRIHTRKMTEGILICDVSDDGCWVVCMLPCFGRRRKTKTKKNLVIICNKTYLVIEVNGTKKSGEKLTRMLLKAA